jgi:hypothetical protein
MRDVTYRGRPAAYRIRYALAGCGPVTLELIQPLEGPSIWDEFLAARGPSLHHVAFYVEDVEAALGLLAGQGWSVVQTGDGFGRSRDGRFVYLEHGDDIGCLVELVRPPRRRDDPELIVPTEPSGPAMAVRPG